MDSYRSRPHASHRPPAPAQAAGLGADDLPHGGHGAVGAGENVLFDAVITPRQGVSPTAFALVAAAIGGGGFLIGFVFFLSGAWPVLGFFGCEVALIYWAFRMVARRGNAFEHLRLTPSALSIRRVDDRGLAEEIELQPFWLKVEIWGRHEAEEIRLRSHGVSHRIGRWLSPAERLDLVEALENALAALRTPPHLAKDRAES